MTCHDAMRTRPDNPPSSASFQMSSASLPVAGSAARCAEVVGEGSDEVVHERDRVRHERVDEPQRVKSALERISVVETPYGRRVVVLLPLPARAPSPARAST